MKNVLVTGATRGLGLAIATRLVDEGYHVIGTGRAPSPQLDGLIKATPRSKRISFSKLNLGTDDMHDFVRETTGAHGHLYGLVNNAAISPDGVLATMHDSQIIDGIYVNVTATVLLTKYATRSMLMHRGGRIINISSIIANTGFNGLSVYAASKAALVGFTKSLARELGKANITVNAIAPGFMETDMTKSLTDSYLDSIKRRTPMKRLVTPADVANGVSYLLSEEAGMVTGTVLTIDGGSTA